MKSFYMIRQRFGVYESLYGKEHIQMALMNFSSFLSLYIQHQNSLDEFQYIFSLTHCVSTDTFETFGLHMFNRWQEHSWYEKKRDVNFCCQASYFNWYAQWSGWSDSVQMLYQNGLQYSRKYQEQIAWYSPILQLNVLVLNS